MTWLLVIHACPVSDCSTCPQPDFWMSKAEYEEKGLRVLEKIGVQA